MRGLFEIANSGLRTAERALTATSNNIINADTPGYTRQRIDRAPVGMSMGGYHTGLGVNITDLTRMRNEMNDVMLNEKRQDYSYMDNKNMVFQQLEAVMTTDTGNDLDMNISNVLDSFSELSSNPQDISVRNSLVSYAEQLTSKFRSLSQSLDRQSELTREGAYQSVDTVNQILKDIQSLNESITQAETAGEADNTALDLRVRKLQELSDWIGFDTQNNGKGGVEIRVGGIVLLDEDTIQPLTTEVDDGNKTFRLRLESGLEIETSGGKLGAEIDLYQQDILALKQQLDDLAASVVQSLNGVHSSGFGIEDTVNRAFFDPSFTTASTISVSQNILDNPLHIAASDVAGEAGNGELAAQIADLRNQPLVNGSRFVDYAIELISAPGTEVNALNAQMEARDAEIQLLNAQQENEAGVNVDEELSLMIRFQNSYQAAAQVLTTAQEMYDTLIGILR
ncbi:MAG: flagellar hook-associated protein FlgK [Bacteroidota bacterium]